MAWLKRFVDSFFARKGCEGVELSMFGSISARLDTPTSDVDLLLKIQGKVPDRWLLASAQGKGGGSRACWVCGGVDHIARACPAAKKGGAVGSGGRAEAEAVAKAAVATLVDGSIAKSQEQHEAVSTLVDVVMTEAEGGREGAIEQGVSEAMDQLLLSVVEEGGEEVDGEEGEATGDGFVVEGGEGLGPPRLRHKTMVFAPRAWRGKSRSDPK